MADKISANKILANKILLKDRRTKEPVYPVTTTDCILDFDEKFKDRFDRLAPIPGPNQIVYSTLNGEIVEIENSISNVYYEDLNYGVVEFEDINRDWIGESGKNFSRSNITDVRLPEGLLEIPEHAFSYCSYLSFQFRYLPSTVTTLNHACFTGIGLGSAIEIPTTITTINGAPFKWNHIPFLSIPDSITTLNQYFCYDNKKLVHLRAPGVTRLEASVFTNCGMLRHFDTSNIVYFGSGTFWYCGIQEVVLNKNAVIENSVFGGCRPKVIDSYLPNINNFPLVNNLEVLILRSSTIVNDVDTYISTFEVDPKPVIPVPKTRSIGANGEPEILPLTPLDTYIGTPNNWLKIYVPATLLSQYQEAYPSLKHHFHPITGEDIYAYKEDLEQITEFESELESKIDSVEEKLDTTTLSIEEELSDAVHFEQVVDGDSFEEFGKITREQLKKDLFIDQWNERCKYGKGVHGRYNEETGYFELNGITDITYEEAIRIMNVPPIRVINTQDVNASTYWGIAGVRTLFPILAAGIYVYIHGIMDCPDLEVLRFMDYYNRASSIEDLDRTEGGTIRPTNVRSCYLNNIIRSNVKKILGIYNDSAGAIGRCASPVYLEHLYLYKIAFDMPGLLSNNTVFKMDCWKFMIKNAANTTQITITVHPDVYAKLLGTGDYSDGNGSREEWVQLNQDALAKNITFATA